MGNCFELHEQDYFGNTCDILWRFYVVQYATAIAESRCSAGKSECDY